VIALSPPTLIVPVIERWRRLPGNLRGGIWMLLGGLEMSTAMAIAKNLTDEIHAFELNFFRCLFGLLAMAPLLFGGGIAIARTKRFGLHLGRGILGGIGQICVFYALAHLSLAVVIAITFTRPLFLVVLAVLFLGELVRWRRWSAIVVGFLGVLIVARPVVDQVTVPLFVLVFSTACHASAHVFLKKATGVDRPATVVFYYLVISTLVGAIPTALVWTTPTAEQFLWLALTGILYLMGQGLIALAFRAGEATAIMPFDYSRLLYGILFDIVLFTHYPDGWTIAGSCVIIASTLYVARRQARVGRARADEPEPLA
jgi:drug/metabolite transporter (DMT)-like permease